MIFQTLATNHVPSTLNQKIVLVFYRFEFNELPLHAGSAEHLGIQWPMISPPER